MRRHKASGTVVPESLNTRKHIGNNTLNNTVKQTLFIYFVILAFSETDPFIIYFCYFSF